MPYMSRPQTDIPLWYGVRLVKEGELVLVDVNDVNALLAEGWKIGSDPDTTNTTIVSKEDE
jgi:hypothetical protein